MAPPEVASRRDDILLYSNVDLKEPSVDDLTPGEKKKYDDARSQFRRASRRYSIVNFVGKRMVEPRVPGFLRVFHKIKPLILNLTTLPPIRAFRAFKFLSRLQKVCCDPYIPDLSNARRLSSKKDANLIKRMNRYCLYAVGVYGAEHLQRHDFKVAKDSQPVSLITSRLKTTLIASREIVQPQRPAWYLFADSTNKELVLGIQGSNSVNDWLTNLLCLPSATGAHEGMSDAAKNLDEELREQVTKFLASKPKYQFILTGHSLGGGVASLLLIRWHQEGSCLAPTITSRMEAWSFGAPCCSALESGDFYEKKIFSITFGRDIVSRLSYGSVRDFLLTLHGLVHTMSRAGKKEIKKRLAEASPVGGTGATDDDPYISDLKKSATASTEDWDDHSSQGSGSDFDVEMVDDVDQFEDGGTAEQSDARKKEETLFGSSYIVPYRRRLESVEDLALDVSKVKVHLPLPFRELNKIVKKRSADYDRRAMLWRPEEDRHTSLFFKMYDCCVRGTTSPVAAKGDPRRDAEDALLATTLASVHAAAISSQEQMMAPAGRYLLIIPRLDFLQQGRELPSSEQAFNKGDCAVYEFTRLSMLRIIREPVWSIKAMCDHSTWNYSQCCNPDTLNKLRNLAIPIDEKFDLMSS